MSAQSSKKRKRTPNDAQWCLNHANTLSLKSFALQFQLCDRAYCMGRYRTILDKYFETDAKDILLNELKQWTFSIYSIDFWKEQTRKKMMSDTHASCSALVNQIIMEEIPFIDHNILALSSILFLVPNEHSALKSRVFGLPSLHSLCDHVFHDLMETNDSTNDNQLTDDEFITITRTINGIDAKTKSIREAKLVLLSFSVRMTGNKANVVEGITNLLTKLPRNRLLNLDKMGEVELQMTYYDAFLSEIIADQDRNVALRWANKSCEEESDIRPDTIISTLMQHDFGYPVGFGEVKPGNSSTTKHSLCMNILRLGIASKRAIDKWHLNGCLAFMIDGFYISFFLVRKQHEHLYTMAEIAAMTVASSLGDLHTFASLKNLDTLSKVSRYFWNHCNVTEHPNVESSDTDDGFVVPISNFYALIDKSCNKSRDISSRY
ncbi:hypothetical protein BCV72DRAFT_290231 [Rhizopus microsporus var. microsporus]|uniref:Uncharacterized protein n=1 Tax=Rhizopus microsporus var. microsporus TaxID=86635 RepID=A0A1X0R6H2_RHIZD|nr:hypothetical protein BCV72DRAFT_290231 [Rhizopus microsporus var. microsporus]